MFFFVVVVIFIYFQESKRPKIKILNIIRSRNGMKSENSESVFGFKANKRKMHKYNQSLKKEHLLEETIKQKEQNVRKYRE